MTPPSTGSPVYKDQNPDLAQQAHLARARRGARSTAAATRRVDRAARYRRMVSELQEETVTELRERASELDIRGRSRMRKRKLIKAIAEELSLQS